MRIAVLVHNAAALLIKPFDETTADEFERVWRVACYGAFRCSRIVVPHMAARKAGAIILTGATAALRGGPKFAAFASAKFALRGLAQSLAREFGPQGVHVAHVVLDGLIDEPQTDARFGPAKSNAHGPGCDRASLSRPGDAASVGLDARTGSAPVSERF